MDAAPVVNRQPTSKKFVDMTGRRFGRLTVEKFIGFGGKIPKWLCSCECGGKKECFSNLLVQGKSQHCGCMSPHDGRSSHELWTTWNGMVARCHSQSHTAFPNYGGRGISVCQRWRDDFWAFVSDVGAKPSPKHSLGRIDNDGNYEPGNVEWQTPKQQMRNTRMNRVVTLNGESLPMSAWAERLGITTEAFRLRLKKPGATIESACLTPKGEVVVCRTKDADRVALSEVREWPSEIFPLGQVVSFACEGDATEIDTKLRRIAGRWGLKVWVRELDGHFMVKFDCPALKQ